MTTWLKDNWLKVLAILMLAGAIYGLPYFAYYQLMNWVVVGAAALTAWQAYKQGQEWVAWLFAFVAVVFNPVAPLYFTVTLWQVADGVAIALFALSFLLIKPRRK